MTQQWSLAVKDKKSDVELVTGYERKEIRYTKWSLCKKDLDKKSKRNDKRTEIPTSVAASISCSDHSYI